MSCDMSPSGEELIFGSAEGYLHLWALNAEPRVSQVSRPLEEVPRLAPPPATTLTESDSFALAALYPPEVVPIPQTPNLESSNKRQIHPCSCLPD